jgi:hypothetical protein
MLNKFGRTEENWYLPTLSQNDKVEFDNGVIKGTGKICGIASESVAVIGKGYIVQPDEPIKNETYEYSHVVIHEVHLNPIKTN